MAIMRQFKLPPPPAMSSVGGRLRQENQQPSAPVVSALPSRGRRQPVSNGYNHSLAVGPLSSSHVPNNTWSILFLLFQSYLFSYLIVFLKKEKNQEWNHVRWQG